MTTRIFDIYGEIVDSISQKQTQEDVCPNDFIEFEKTIEPDDEIQININSIGGSVTSGVSIANKIIQLSKEHKTIAKVDGYACSIASIIACACSELHMSKSSFLMIHQVWGNVCGNSEELRKEANLMEQMTKSLLPFYHMKFDLTDEELMELIKNETWISGAQAKDYKLDIVTDDYDDDETSEYFYAAKLTNFKNLPKALKDKFDMKKDIVEEQVKEIEEQEEQIKKIEEQIIEQEEVKEEEISNPPVVEEEKEIKEEIKEEVVEEVKEEKEEQKTTEELEETIKELEAKIEELEKEIECSTEERISKCQSKFQNKINNFINELKAKEQELLEANAKVSRLNLELDNAKNELHLMSESFEAKKTALEQLNSNVLAMSDELLTYEEGIKLCKTPEERIKFISSGKYTNH